MCFCTLMMIKYKKIFPNQLINLIESKDAQLHEKDMIIAELDALWTTPEAREYRHQGEKGRKLGYKLEPLHIIMTTAEELHANTGCQIEKFSWMLAHFRKFMRERLYVINQTTSTIIRKLEQNH